MDLGTLIIAVSNFSRFGKNAKFYTGLVKPMKFCDMLRNTRIEKLCVKGSDRGQTATKGKQLRRRVGGAMGIAEQLNRQRVRHIIDSYQLNGDDSEEFFNALELLLPTYPTILIELALVETLIEHWLSVPLVKGLKFLEVAQRKLNTWTTESENQVMISLTPEQFQQITGLDPTPIFGVTQPSPIQSKVPF